MAKHLRQIVEYKMYYPKAKGEQKFYDQHTVKSNADRNGNGENVRNASGTKPFDRKKNREGVDADQGKNSG